MLDTTLRAETPEGVELDMRPAGPVPRALAWLIDLLWRVAALLVIYVLLGVLYESFIHPLTILAGLPSAAVGALLMLQLFGQDLTLIATIGILLLIGIVKKNAIMMIDFALDVERREGLSPREAIYRAAFRT